MALVVDGVEGLVKKLPTPLLLVFGIIAVVFGLVIIISLGSILVLDLLQGCAKVSHYFEWA
jgi:hypothetical protein